jgi:hypothetical protein
VAIPAFVNGLLPPGVYPATFQEVWSAFDQHGSTTRAALNLALEHAATLIWSRDTTALLYVNGSYVTDKRDPADVDLAVRSDVWTDTSFLAAFVAAYPHETTLVDFYFNPMHSTQHMEDLFQLVQGTSLHKGIIRLHP